MVALFLDDNKTNDDGDGKKKRQKSNRVLLTTKNFHLHRSTLYISLPSMHHCDMELPNFIPTLYGVGEHNRKVVFFFF